MLLLVIFAVCVWWLGTAIVVASVRRPQSGAVSMLAVIAVLGASLGAIEASQALATAGSAMVSFVAAVVIWGALELAHLAGWLTGPQKDHCPPDLRGPQRFFRAVQVGLYHDLMILLFATALWLLLWEQPNNVAAWTFSSLWLMRWSAKLNLYLGVANFDQRLVPERMEYMASYMRQRVFNPLFPVSVALGLGLVWMCFVGATSLSAGEHLYTGYVLVGTLAALGLVEHVLLMLPLRDSQLWQWALPVNERSRG